MIMTTKDTSKYPYVLNSSGLDGPSIPATIVSSEQPSDLLRIEGSSVTVSGSSYDWSGLTVRFRFVFYFNLKSRCASTGLLSTTLTVHQGASVLTTKNSFTETLCIYLFYIKYLI